jgi:hypothetical protein
MEQTEPVGVTEGKGRETRYYHDLGRACDYLLRCKDCKALVLASDLSRRGVCICGCKRVTEIVTLSEDEHAQIASGALDFPYREQFLAEFSAIE